MLWTMIHLWPAKKSSYVHLWFSGRPLRLAQKRIAFNRWDISATKKFSCKSQISYLIRVSTMTYLYFVWLINYRNYILNRDHKQARSSKFHFFTSFSQNNYNVVWDNCKRDKITVTIRLTWAYCYNFSKNSLIDRFCLNKDSAIRFFGLLQAFELAQNCALVLRSF